MLLLGENIQVLPRWLLNPLLKCDNVADAVDAAVHPFCPVVSITLGDHPFSVSLSGKSWLVKSWPGFILFLTNGQFRGGLGSSLIPGKWEDLSRKGFFSWCEISLFTIILSHCKLRFFIVVGIFILFCYFNFDQNHQVERPVFYRLTFCWILKYNIASDSCVKLSEII